jgi:hypothetical protein
LAEEKVVDLFLPGDEAIPGWRTDGALRVYFAEELYGIINGGAELFLEFGFEKLLVRHYLKGKHELELAVYEMKDNFAALGIFCIKRGRGRPSDQIGTENTFSKYQVLLQRGKYFVMITNPDGNTSLEKDMVRLAEATIALLGDASSPSILDLLPGKDLILPSIRLIRGPLALETAAYYPEEAIDFKACVGIYGDYQSPGGTVSMLRLRLNDSKAVNRQIKTFCAYGRMNTDPDTNLFCTFVFPGRNTPHYLFHQDRILTILTGPTESFRPRDFYNTLFQKPPLN